MDSRRMPSRVQGPQRILAELRRLAIKNARSLRVRASRDEEVVWSRRVADWLARLIEEGDAVLTPAPSRRIVRKKGRLF